MNNLDKKLIIKSALINISSLLNEKNINWALGGSLLLYLYEIDTSVADIDIVVDEVDKEKVKELIKCYFHIEKAKSDLYLTERFYTLTIDNVDIDLMVGFKIKTINGVYSFPSGSKLSDKSIIIDDTVIYLSSLKDWLEAYIAMGRKNKVDLIIKSKLVK